MAWNQKYYIGSIWIRDKTTETTREWLFGFPNQKSIHSHRVEDLEGSVVYNRVVSGIEPIISGNLVWNV